MVETIKITAGNIVPGDGFTIYGTNTSEFNAHLELVDHDNSNPSKGGEGTRIWGQWRVSWAWA
jgi:hypothetical protein